MLERLSGGAIQENWGLSVVRKDGREERLVLRRDAAAQIRGSRSRAEEFQLLRLAHGSGVPVPEPIALCMDSGVFDRPFFLMRRIEGLADPWRLAREDALVPDRARLGR
ncbi:MAG: phosphotransferase, partial [Nitrososphaerales archaeon]